LTFQYLAKQGLEWRVGETPNLMLIPAISSPEKVFIGTGKLSV